MKRALAERVKQEMGDPIVPGPSAPPGYTSMNGVSGGGSPDGHNLPPSKIPRTNMSNVASSSTSSIPMAPVSASPHGIPQSSMGDMMSMEVHSTGGNSAGMKRPLPNASSSGNVAAYQSSQNPPSTNHVHTSNNNAATATTATPKGRGPGRPRKSAIKQDSSDDDDDDKDNSSFYLKQQNSSLASELYAYRRRIYLLEREREFRRRECRVAGYKIGKLGGVWKGLESAIGKEFESNDFLKQVCLCYYDMWTLCPLSLLSIHCCSKL